MKICRLLVLMGIIFSQCNSMKQESDIDNRDSSLRYSTEITDFSDFNCTPMNSPREEISVTLEKKESWFTYLCCCCCYKKPTNRLVLHYETIQ